MVPIVLSIIVVCCLLIVFSRPRRRDGLAPEGGSRIKNLLAVAMVKSGVKRRPDWQSISLADSRVPVPEGVDESQYNDSFVFHGSDEKGNTILTRLGFRGGGRGAEVWFWGVFGGKRFANDTRHIALPADADPRAVEAAGLRYERVAEGTWRITFSGTFDGADASVDLTWSADAAMYCSADHMDAKSTALAMAEMPWSREYFERISSEKQIRIEQGGFLKGQLTAGDEVFNVDMRGIRDHSWGKRDWTFLNRYTWNVLALDEPMDVLGIGVKYLAVSLVDYGDSFRRLASGWLAGDEGVLPVSFATDLMEIGGDGVIPERFTVKFRVPGSPVMTLEMDRRQPEMPWMVQEGHFEVNEAWCGITLDGRGGYGSI
jgi:hypothetical protein